MGDDANDTLPLTGYPGPAFHALHLTGIASIVASIIASVLVLVYMFRVRDNTHSFSRWPLGERLVIYLAVIDVCWGVNHGADHLFTYIALRQPGRALCAFFGFTLQLFMSAQSLLVMFAAMNAFFLLVKQKRVKLGRGDWRLLTFCFLPPTLLGGVFVSLGYLGPNGAWCHVDMRRKPEGVIIYTIYTSMVVGVFAINSICYTSVCITIKRSSADVAKFQDSTCDLQQRHAQSRRVVRMSKSLTLIVAAYICQWWPFLVLTFWSYIGKPHIAWLIVVVVFCNAGGIFNGVAYTVMKVRNQSNGSKRASQLESSSNVSELGKDTGVSSLPERY